MIVRDDLRASEPVVVHQRPQCGPDVRFLGGSEDAGGVRRIGVLGLVLDPDRVCGDPLILKSLQGLQEVHRI